MYLRDPEPGLEEEVLGLKNELQEEQLSSKGCMQWVGSLMQEVTTTCVLYLKIPLNSLEST